MLPQPRSTRAPSALDVQVGEEYGPARGRLGHRPLRALPAPVDPAWSRPCLAIVAAFAAVLMAWGLARNGYANTYYASAVYAASKSWGSFFVNALDLSGYVTVDKTPLSVWLMALSARIFGFSSLSMLMPNALCGVASVLVLHNVVKRTLGPRVAILAALALALTPVTVVVSRFNNPDALLVLLLICSAWAVTRAIESGRTGHLVICGVLIGLAFNTKMLQAYVVAPAIAVAFLATAPGTPRRRLCQLAVSGGAMLAVSLLWVAAMMLISAGDRPWVGDTTANSWWQLVFGANGVARIGPGYTGPSAGGGTGLLRLFSEPTGAQIAWLMPLAAVGLAGGLWTTRRARRRDPGRGAFLLWGGWALVHFLIFSVALNIFHPYYSSAIAPAVAVLAASGLVMLWDRHNGSLHLKAVSGVTLLGGASLAVVLIGRVDGFVPWLPWIVIGLALACTVGVLALGRPMSSRRWLRAIVVVAGLTSVLAGPTAYSIATLGKPLGGMDPVAGPAVHAATGGSLESGEDPGRSALIRYLVAHRGNTRYLAAIGGSLVAAPIILATRQPVVTMGGFAGTDVAPTALQLQQLITAGQLRFVLMSDTAPAAIAGLNGLGLGGGEVRARWVTSHCTATGVAPEVTSALGVWRQRIYDCARAT
jgi:4-amino-4-deoxy-L-arabinose transferase-like glycosyltransferase